MSSILDKVRRLNWLLQESTTGKFSLNEMIKVISDIMDANVYLVDYKGSVLGLALKDEGDNALRDDDETGAKSICPEYNEELLKISETTRNVQGDDVLKLFKYDVNTSSKYHTIIPVVCGGNRWGTMVTARYEPQFTDEDLVICEYGATIVGVEIQQQRFEAKTIEEHEADVVKLAMGTLSYSETEAVKHIFKELEGDEGILVASRIADRSGITRSVIVNALRKLESASVIDTRSLGMKGTRIKILNAKLKEELMGSN